MIRALVCLWDNSRKGPVSKQNFNCDLETEGLMLNPEFKLRSEQGGSREKEAQKACLTLRDGSSLAGAVTRCEVR